MAEATVPSEKTLSVNGLKLHYLDWGNPGAPPLVLIHGMTSLAHVFDHLARGLAGSYHVIAFDQRGHGDSDSSPQYTEALYLSDLEGVVSQLGLKRPILVGMSIGARTAAEYAIKHPDGVARVVAIEGPVWTEKEMKEYGEMLASMRDFAVPNRELVLEKMAGGNPRYNREILKNYLEHNLKPNGAGGLTWKYDRELRGGQSGAAFLAETTAPRWELWRGLKTPTLIVRGAESTGTTHEIAERLAKENPQIKAIHVPNAGGAVHVEQPDALLQTVSSWLKG
jgi:esterase